MSRVVLMGFAFLALIVVDHSANDGRVVRRLDNAIHRFGAAPAHHVEGALAALAPP
jgi:ApbE superfamily uncharacterized protein (UPF0280 family)